MTSNYLFQVIIVTAAFALTSVLAYHDPDLNYHLSQVQKLDCGDGGYTYPQPAVRLTTAGVKAAPNVVFQPAASGYQYANTAGYTAGIAYQAEAPKLTYAGPPPAAYQTVVSHANYAQAPVYTTQVQQKEVHGYATSAGLSSARTVTPQATYAQAPIIAKVTAAPLIAKFALAPAKTTYVTQNLAQPAYAGSQAKASLNAYTTHGGPVVTQLYAAPAAKYATSSALRVQQVQQVQYQQAQAPARYTTIAAPSVSQYKQVAPISGLTPVAQVAPAYGQAVTHYATSSVNHVSGSNSQYAAPAVSQYAAPIRVQYQQYSAPAAQQYTSSVTHHHSAPAVVQQYAAPAVVKQYVAPAVTQHYAPAVAQYHSPAQYVSHGVSHGVSHQQQSLQAAHSAQYSGAAVAQYAAPIAVPHGSGQAFPVRVAGGPSKNVHSEFLENYVSTFINYYSPFLELYY